MGALNDLGRHQEALETIELSTPDLILSDVNMPEMNGIEFVKAVRTNHEKDALPMVMITTEGSEAMIQTAMDSGANGFVTKPFTPDSIQEALEQYFG